VTTTKANLHEIVDVRNKTVNADFDKHHQCSADILANLRIFVRRQKEQTLYTVTEDLSQTVKSIARELINCTTFRLATERPN